MQCIACAIGWYQKENSCLPCEAGTYGPSEGSTACLECTTGSFADSQGMSHCEHCARGYYAPALSHTTCIECSEGLTIPPIGGSLCQYNVTCSQANLYFSTRIVPMLNQYEGCIECTICGAKTFTTQTCSGTTDSTCSNCIEECPIRTAMTKYCTLYNDSICTPICLPGEDKNCQACKPGTMMDILGETCIPCPNGMYSSYEGSTACQTCDSMMFPNGAKTECVLECERGAFINLNDTTLQIYCELCKPGTYHATGQGCLACPANTFSREYGQSSCESCGVDGSVSLPGSMACSLQTCMR